MSHTPRTDSPFTGRTPTGRKARDEPRARTAEAIVRSLPLVRAIVRTIQEVSRELQVTVDQADDCVERLEQLGPLLDGEAFLMDLGDEIHRLQESLTTQASEIEELGGVLVDPTAGRIDFSSKLDGQPISYCWSPEDTGLDYVHPRAEDCDHRRPIG